MLTRSLALTALLLAGCSAVQDREPQRLLGVVDLNIDCGDADDDLADVFVDGDFVGNGSMEFPLREGSYVLRVEMAGFEPFERRLRVLAKSNDQEVNAVLAPLAGPAR